MLFRSKDPTFVFTGLLRCPTPIWRRALKEAKLDGSWVWHHLRHTWASWHAMAGTPLHVIQTMGGWSTPHMLQRYAHLSQDHLIEEAKRIAINVDIRLAGERVGDYERGRHQETRGDVSVYPAIEIAIA